MSASMRFFLLFAAFAVFSASACSKVNCLQGTLDVGLDRSGLFVRLTTGEWAFDAAPTTAQGDYCVLAYGGDCQISAYAWTTSLGLLPAPAGDCQLTTSGGVNRVFCTCQDQDNCHLDFVKYTTLAMQKGVKTCPLLPDRPAHIPMPSACAPAVVVAAPPPPETTTTTKKPDAASGLCIWTSVIAVAGIFFVGDVN